MSDICSDCGRVGIVGPDLYRCGRNGDDGEWLEIRLCIDCLFRVNPHMQAGLLAAASTPHTAALCAEMCAERSEVDNDA